MQHLCNSPQNVAAIPTTIVNKRNITLQDHLRTATTDWDSDFYFYEELGGLVEF